MICIIFAMWELFKHWLIKPIYVAFLNCTFLFIFMIHDILGTGFLSFSFSFFVDGDTST